jgi:HEPN domain-containing protein
MRPEAQAWWELALADLETARKMISAGAYYMAAFLCQQSVEKGLKAVWMVRNRRLAPKTHNLLDLAEELSVLSRFESALLRLNPQYVATRYPDAANGLPSRNYNEEIARSLLHDADEVIAWCRSELGPS